MYMYLQEHLSLPYLPFLSHSNFHFLWSFVIVKVMRHFKCTTRTTNVEEKIQTQCIIYKKSHHYLISDRCICMCSFPHLTWIEYHYKKRRSRRNRLEEGNTRVSSFLSNSTYFLFTSLLFCFIIIVARIVSKIQLCPFT